MSNPCQFGSSPSPDAPAYFTFDDLDIAHLGSWVHNWVNLDTLNISTKPQNTAVFCKDPPERDFPAMTDYAFLAIPGSLEWSIAVGRFANLVKWNKWVSLAVCNQGPAPVIPSDPPQGYFPIIREWPLTWSDDGASHFRIVLPFFTVPAGATKVAARMQSVTGGHMVVQGLLADQELVENTQENDSRYAGHFVEDFPFGDDAGTWTTWDITGLPHPTLHGALTIRSHIYVDGSPLVGVQNATIDIAYKPGDIGTPGDPITISTPPPDLPTPVDECSTADLPSLCKKLDALLGRVNQVAAQVAPGYPVPAGEPVQPTPAAALPDGSVPGTLPIDKPVEATGAVIQIISTPPYEPSHGTGIKFWPELGHVALVTPLGPLPSQLIKHNPLVLLPIPPQVTQIALDLADGVVAQVQWLRQPK